MKYKLELPLLHSVVLCNPFNLGFSVAGHFPPGDCGIFINSQALKIDCAYRYGITAHQVN